MTKPFLIATTIVPLLLVGCGSSSSEPSEAQLRKDLSGPPSLQKMREKMQGKTAGPTGKTAEPAAGAPGAAAPAAPAAPTGN